MSRRIGSAAEDAAARFLARQGFEILARNYTIRGAEVDIIAKDGAFIVFVEVKHRKSAEHGVGRESVTLAKQRRICMAALAWLQQHDLPDAPVRFDIVESTPQGLSLLRAAFSFIS